jgi:hypothetical protein
MHRKRFAVSLAIFAALVWTAATSVSAQCDVTTVASGLRAPVKIIPTSKGDLLVAEAGIAPNTGRISLIDPVGGERRTLIDGLPSGFSPPDNAPSGPSGLAMRGRTLYLTIGNGDTTLAGSVPGTDVPNPQPSSPIFSSVLALHFSAHVERTTGGFSLTGEDHQALKDGLQIQLDNGRGDRLTVRLVADFPDWISEPRPGEPNNVRHSNPFGLALADDELYVADASMNSVRVVELETGNTRTLVTFPPLPNTRGFGPPFVEAVPDGIRVLSPKQLLVTLLSGFPFPLGEARVLVVDRDTGETEPFITGLTSAIDVLPFRNGGPHGISFLTLEFSADMLVPGTPGRLTLFAPDTAPVVLSDCLITPTGMARDERTGGVFVTEIATGRVVGLTP